MVGVRRLWLVPIGVVVAALAGVLVRRATRDDAPPAGDERALLAREAVLEARVALEKADGLYLLLDARRSSLELWRGPALLRGWPLRSMAIGERRAAAWGRAPAAASTATFWEAARLEPPVRRTRKVIVSDEVAPPDPTGAVDWIPPTPEEEVPLPSRFVIHFSGGLGMEVLVSPADSAAAKRGTAARLRVAAARLRPRNWDRLRIRAEMDPAEAGALYRSLPEGIPLVCMPDGT